MKRRNDGLDFLKFICSFMVVCIHAPFPKMLGNIVVPIARIAVPVFFMITGYFYTVIRENKAEKKQLSKIAKIFVGANTVYLIYSIIIDIIKGEHLLSRFSLKSMIKFLFLNESPFGSHLWYLGAILYVLVIVYFFEKKWKVEKIYIFVPILLLCDLLLGKYSLLVFGKEFPYIIVRNFLFVGLPYFLIGDMLFKARLKIKPNILVLGTVLFSGTTLLERYLLEILNKNATRDHYISTSGLAISAFLLACYIGDKTEKRIYKRCCSIGAKLSLGIYVLHPMVITILHKMGSVISNVTVRTIWDYLTPIVVFVISIIAAMVLHILCKKARKYYTKRRSEQ